MQRCTKPVPFNGVIVCRDGTLTFDPAVFLVTFPEFSKLTEGTIVSFGEQSISFLSQGSFGVMFPLAVALLTAHRLATTYDLSDEYSSEGKNDQTSTEVGASKTATTSSLSEGSQPLALVMGDDPFTIDLARTNYGLQLLALIKTWVPGGELVEGIQIGAPVGTMQWPPVNAGY